MHAITARRASAALLGSLVLLLALTGARVAEASAQPPGACTAVAARGAAASAPGHRVQHDRCVRLNQVQVLGTHNSYHLQPHPSLLATIRSFEALVGMPGLGDSIEYSHPPLAVQLDQEGIRQIELDVFADPAGGKYAAPRGLGFIPPVDWPLATLAQLVQPGFKVLHVQDIDVGTTCATLVACLGEVRAWSDANRGHLPLAILIEGKSDPIPDPGFGFQVPLPFDAATLDALDAEIRSVLGDRLITPDAVRGGRTTLEAAVRAGAWPTLEQARGKVVVLFNNGGADRQRYIAGRPSLQGRAMFTTSTPGQPDAAFVQVGDPRGAGGQQIADLVRAGYLVRTRSDVPTVEARSGDVTRRDAAFASGAHFVSTDYPRPSPFGSGYEVRLPGGGAGRCNPVNAPAGCRDGLLE
jgi:hypothetical protein